MTTPSHSIGLGPQAAAEGLGDHRGRGGVGNEEEGLQTGSGDAQLLGGSASRPSPSPRSPGATLGICMVTTEPEQQEPGQLRLRPDVSASFKI